MSIRVEDVMARDVVTVDCDFSAKYAARIMNYYGISSLVATSEEEIVGILTERDLITRIVAVGQNPEKVMVRDVMSKPIIIVSPTMPLEDAVKIMFQKKIKKLPVVNRAKDCDELVGMLSLTDVARLQPQMIETMKELLSTGAYATEETANFYVR